MEENGNQKDECHRKMNATEKLEAFRIELARKEAYYRDVLNTTSDSRSEIRAIIATNVIDSLRTYINWFGMGTLSGVTNEESYKA